MTLFKKKYFIVKKLKHIWVECLLVLIFDYEKLLLILLISCHD